MNLNSREICYLFFSFQYLSFVDLQKTILKFDLRFIFIILIDRYFCFEKRNDLESFFKFLNDKRALGGFS